MPRYRFLSVLERNVISALVWERKNGRHILQSKYTMNQVELLTFPCGLATPQKLWGTLPVFLLLCIWISLPVINRGKWINKSKQFEIPSTWKRHYMQCVYCLSANRRLWIRADMLWGGVHRTYLCISGMCDKDLFVFNDHQWFTMNRCENWVNHITYMVFESFKQCQWVYNKIIQHS